MAKFSSFRGGSAWLKVADLGGREHLLTIESCRPERVGEQEKVVVRFEGRSKALVLNDANLDVLEMAFGPETNDAVGGLVILYVDPDVEFDGKKVGGIRIKRPTTREAYQTETEIQDEIPF
jgi:hypothetical protein